MPEAQLSKAANPIADTAPEIADAAPEVAEPVPPLVVGFSAQTKSLLTQLTIEGKLEKKRVDLVVANHADDGFGGRENLVTLVDAAGAEALPRMSKRAVADRLLDRVVARLADVPAGT